MRRLALPLLAALTLGLAPFVPEPHLVGKIRWVAGGAVGMSAVDYFDLAIHGAPWLWLLGALFTTLRAKLIGAEGNPPRWQVWALGLALALAALCVVVAIATR